MPACAGGSQPPTYRAAGQHQPPRFHRNKSNGTQVASLSCRTQTLQTYIHMHIHHHIHTHNHTDTLGVLSCSIVNHRHRHRILNSRLLDQLSPPIPRQQ